MSFATMAVLVYLLWTITPLMGVIAGLLIAAVALESWGAE